MSQSFKDYKVYAGKLPEYLEKTESQMTESEKAFDAKIWHYFKIQKRAGKILSL